MSSLGKVYTLSEVGNHLRMTNRAVAKIARAHGLCTISGRTMTFTEEDIDAIKQAMRVAPKEPRRVPMKPYPSDVRLQESLMKLSAKKSRKRRSD
jgi:hypothetical protein